MLWVDKHRPKRLADLSYNEAVSDRLKALAANSDSMPHLFFYGASGAGKKTRVSALLYELYGPGAEKLKLDKRVFKTPTDKTVEINMITSNFHIELSPGDAGLNDRFVVQDVIKEMAANKNIASIATSSSKAPVFKTVVLLEVERLSRQAQAALRRTMEKYASSCRLILCSNSQSKVIEPLRSRCLGIRVAAPTVNEVCAMDFRSPFLCHNSQQLHIALSCVASQICSILQKVASKETTTLPDELAVNIARESNRNLRRGLLMLEAATVQNRDGLTKDQPVQKTDWELYIGQLASEITKEQTPQRLMAAREKLYELLVSCIPATVILKTLTKELMKNLDDGLKMEVSEWAAFYEHRIAMGSKEIFHLEAFIARYMCIYKKYLTDLFG
jgi:replication factor C subunit 3/5